MGRLTSTLVVDLVDKTGAKSRAIIGNMDRLKRAERDYMLSDKGLRLSSKDRAMERLMIEREADLERRRARVGRVAGLAAAGVVTAGIAAGRAYASFAELERRVNRIVINADKGADAIQPTIAKLQKIAAATRTGFDEVVEGLETLVASGRSLEESLAFLPAVALTAQASGAAMSDIALSADSLSGSLKISATEMQRAFDILVAGGKAGKFELKDMAQYLPSLLPAFSALGYKGTEGLQKIVGMLQIVRNQTGSSSEAATNLGNILNKMYSEETAKKFAKMGVDLPAALAKAKKEGRDVLDVFLDLTMVATKGDLSKLTQLFTDAEYQKGVRALVTQRPELEAMIKSLENVDGTAMKDFTQIIGDSAAKIQRMTNLWDKFVKQIGAGVATVANPALEGLTNTLDDLEAQSNALSGLSGKDRQLQKTEFFRRYDELYPDASKRQKNIAYNEALRAQGRGEQFTVYDGLNRESGARAGGATTGLYPSRGSYGQYRDGVGLGAGPATGAIGYPTARPSEAERMASARAGASRYPSQGDYYGFTDQGDGNVSARPDQVNIDMQALMQSLEAGGQQAGGKISAEMEGSASRIGRAIGAAAAQEFVSRASGRVTVKSGDGGRPTGQVLKEQMNGQFVDQ